MFFRKSTRLFVLGAVALSFSVGNANALDKVTVAYFLEWPTANQVAQLENTYQEEMGVEVEWRPFGNGNEMTDAMVAGEVDIAYSQGFVPFVVGVTNGAPLKMVSIAVTYSENDLCIVRNDSGITQANARELEGKRIATPIGNVTHYKLLRTMEDLGVDVNRLLLVQMNPPEAAAALVAGEVVMACAFGGVLERMKTVGRPIMSGSEQESVGIYTFDIVAVTENFAAEHPEMVRKFLEVTETANAAYYANPKPVYEKVSKASGLDLAATKASMSTFGFPSIDDQLCADWMGGGVQAASLGVANVMASVGGLQNPLDDYSPFVDSSFLK